MGTSFVNVRFVVKTAELPKALSLNGVRGPEDSYGSDGNSSEGHDMY